MTIDQLDNSSLCPVSEDKLQKLPGYHPMLCKIILQQSEDVWYMLFSEALFLCCLSHGLLPWTCIPRWVSDEGVLQRAGTSVETRATIHATQHETTLMNAPPTSIPLVPGTIQSLVQVLSGPEVCIPADAPWVGALTTTHWSRSANQLFAFAQKRIDGGREGGRRGEERKRREHKGHTSSEARGDIEG